MARPKEIGGLMWLWAIDGLSLTSFLKGEDHRGSYNTRPFEFLPQSENLIP